MRECILHQSDYEGDGAQVVADLFFPARDATVPVFTKLPPAAMCPSLSAQAVRPSQWNEGHVPQSKLNEWLF